MGWRTHFYIWQQTIALIYASKYRINSRFIPVLFTVVEMRPTLSHVPVKLTELGTKIHLCHMFTNLHYSPEINDLVVCFCIARSIINNAGKTKVTGRFA